MADVNAERISELEALLRDWAGDDGCDCCLCGRWLGVAQPPRDTPDAGEPCLYCRTRLILGAPSESLTREESPDSTEDDEPDSASTLGVERAPGELS